MFETIQKELTLLEQKENIKILFAIESGSRAWGFASRDSDYDVRFVYVRPLENYLSIDDRKDVVELPINDVLDINGWDIRKALRLFRSSNAALYEWIQSPVVYRDELGFKDKLRSMSADYFSLRAGMHHYLSMTKNSLDNDLKADEVKLKRYFYALRNILSCRWIREKKEVPPMEFAILRDSIAGEQELNGVIDEWLVQKMEGDEKYQVKGNTLINDFISGEVKASEVFAQGVEKWESDIEVLNGLFRETLSESQMGMMG